MHLGDGVGAVQRRLDDLVPASPDDVEKDPVAFGPVGLCDELSGPEHLRGIVQGLIGMMDDEHGLGLLL